MPKDASPNGGASPRRPVGPRRVSEMQAKLHRWAVADRGRRFDDLFNLVHDPETLIAAWLRVAANQGGQDGGLGWVDRHPDRERKSVSLGFWTIYVPC
jgi:RNA-directed DNA polymerase